MNKSQRTRPSPGKTRWASVKDRFEINEAIKTACTRVGDLTFRALRHVAYSGAPETDEALQITLQSDELPSPKGLRPLLSAKEVQGLEEVVAAIETEMREACEAMFRDRAVRAVWELHIVTKQARRAASHSRPKGADPFLEELEGNPKATTKELVSNMAKLGKLTLEGDRCVLPDGTSIKYGTLDSKISRLRRKLLVSP